MQMLNHRQAVETLQRLHHLLLVLAVPANAADPQDQRDRWYPAEWLALVAKMLQPLLYRLRKSRQMTNDRDGNEDQAEQTQDRVNMFPIGLALM